MTSNATFVDSFSRHDDSASSQHDVHENNIAPKLSSYCT
jgi:hypothetical protein